MKKSSKKWIISTAAFIISILFFMMYFLFNSSKMTVYKSKVISVYDIEKNEYVEELNNKTRTTPASITKVMSTLVAVENISDLDEKVEYKLEYVEDIIGQDYAMAGLINGEMISYKDLIYASILTSGADAVRTIEKSMYYADGMFVEKMNDTAKKIGMRDTMFDNSIGMYSENNYSTAQDITKMYMYIKENHPFLYQVLNTDGYTMSQTNKQDAYTIYHTVIGSNNVKLYGIKGGKSGTTKEDGRNWAVYYKDPINNRDYIVVTMSIPYTKNYDYDNPPQLDDIIEISKNINKD